MGQILSKDNSSRSNTNSNITQHEFSKVKVVDYFDNCCRLQFRPVEIKAIASKLGVENLKDGPEISIKDLAYLFQLTEDKNANIESLDNNIQNVLEILSNSFKVIGNFPFLQDGINPNLSIGSLLKSAYFHSGRYKKLLTSDYDYLKLVFISLSNIGRPDVDEKTDTSTSSMSNNEKKEKESYSLDVCDYTDDDDDSTLFRKINWKTFSVILSVDDVDLDSICIDAQCLLQLMTFFLIISSVPMQSHTLMQQHLSENIADWSRFEACSLSIIRYLNVDINADNIGKLKISFEQFNQGISNGLLGFFTSTWMRLFKNGLLSSVNAVSQINSSKVQENPVQTVDSEQSSVIKKKSTIPKFAESKLINAASIALISICLTALNSNVSVDMQNLIKLYAGSESGFSIRSLELKIFKWQAPTLLIVSGKRVKGKTITHNNRYHQFNEIFPQYFRSLENPKRDWQNDNDLVTYAVVVKLPWKNSNKNNFGDENTVIINLLPRFDFYKSTHNPVLNGKLIYFNNLGMGLGFGNNQPINKSTIKKFLPGDVSLTIESNLEFAVFRHVTSNSNAACFFENSKQISVSNEDFEDRFMITDLEVWGIGSTKELQEQKKQWAWEEKQAEARQSVNLRGLGEERAFLEMVGLVGNHNTSGGSM